MCVLSCTPAPPPFLFCREQRQMSVLQKVKVNDVDIPEGVTKYDLYKVRLVHYTPRCGAVRCAVGMLLVIAF